MAVDDASETVASGTFQFSELLISPQNKIHGTVPLTGTRSCEAIIGFGILQCWYQLSCSLSLIKSYIQHRIADKVRFLLQLTFQLWSLGCCPEYGGCMLTACKTVWHYNPEDHNWQPLWKWQLSKVLYSCFPPNIGYVRLCYFS